MGLLLLLELFMHVSFQGIILWMTSVASPDAGIARRINIKVVHFAEFGRV